MFDTYGADAWYERPLEEFIPDGLTCPACGGTAFERERDILDVWFDSGSSHEAVLPFRPELTWPADVYLEGSDQHRGWFQSSLLVGFGTRGRPPFRAVVTHGFIVDEAGRKMSKSLGNGIEPQDVIKESGAEIIRLWVAMVDYREEVRLGKQILARYGRSVSEDPEYAAVPRVESLRFRSGADRLPLDRMQEVDRYRPGALRAHRADARCLRRPTTFRRSSRPSTSSLTVDLSAFYADVSKDRLYTLRAPVRRSGGRRRPRCIVMADGLARLLAPILPVMADELWRHLPGKRAKNRFTWPNFPPDVDALSHAELMATWARLLEIRDEVNRALETARQAKIIGNSLGAHVTLARERRDGGAARRPSQPICRCCSSSRSWIVETEERPDDSRFVVAKAKGDEVPALLAHRADRSRTTRTRWGSAIAASMRLRRRADCRRMTPA